MTRQALSEGQPRSGLALRLGTPAPGPLGGGPEGAEGDRKGPASLHLSTTANRPQDRGPEKASDGLTDGPLTGCPTMSGWVYFDYETGQVRPARCGRNRCAFCLTINARRRAAAIAYAEPEREITLTQVGNDWATVRSRVNKIAELLRRKDYTVLMDWHVEANPKGTGHHVHVWQKGSRVPQSVLSDVAARSGAGSVVHISRLRNVAGASTYGLKGLAPARYGLKGTVNGPEYLTLNGGRLSHHSRGFYVSPSGATIGVRQAEGLGLRALYGQDEQEHSWTLVRETSLGSVERVRTMQTARASVTPASPAL